MDIRALDVDACAVPVHDSRSGLTLTDINLIGLTERLRALEEENCSLQSLVCYLLRKNENLRMQICQQLA